MLFIPHFVYIYPEPLKPVLNKAFVPFRLIFTTSIAHIDTKNRCLSSNLKFIMRCHSHLVYCKTTFTRCCCCCLVHSNKFQFQEDQNWSFRESKKSFRRNKFNKIKIEEKFSFREKKEIKIAINRWTHADILSHLHKTTYFVYKVTWTN